MRIRIFLLLLLFIATIAGVKSLNDDVDGVTLDLDSEEYNFHFKKVKKAKRTDSDLPPASSYQCNIYCRDPRESIIWSDRYNFSHCNCQVDDIRKQSFTQIDIENFWKTMTDQSTLDDLFGKPETLTSRLTRSYKIMTPVASFLIDIIVFIIGMYWGAGFGTSSAIVGSLILFFNKGGSFYNTLLSAAIRIAIGQVSPGMRDYNYIAIVAVMVEVIMIALGATAGSVVAVPLLFVASLTANGIIVMLTQSNKFRMDVVSSIVLITMQFIQTVGEILPIHFSRGRSYVNFMVLVIRAMCNSSSSNADLTTVTVHSDVMSSWAAMPYDMFKMFEDLQTAYISMIIFFALLRFASVITMRLMLAQIPFKRPHVRHSFTEWVQRISMTCLYFPFKNFGDYTVLHAVVNMIFFLWTFRCAIEVFLFLVIAVIITWAVLGDFCVDFDFATGKVKKHLDRAKVKSVKHLSKVRENEYIDTLIQSASIPEQVIDRHIDFLKKNATLPAEAVKLLHKWDVSIRTRLGRASAVIVGRNQLLTVKHVFMDVVKALPNDLEAYTIHINGMDLIPQIVEAGNSDIDGETIMRLTFNEDISNIDYFPSVGPLVVEDYAMHMVSKQGGLSMTSEVFDIEGRPQLIGYGHTCIKSDSGRAGYAIDGVPKLVSLHIGATKNQMVGLLIDNPDKPFRPVAYGPIDDNRDGPEDKESDQWPIDANGTPTQPLQRHSGVREVNTPVARELDPGDHLFVRIKRNVRGQLNRLNKQYLKAGKDNTSVVVIQELLAKLE